MEIQTTWVKLMAPCVGASPSCPRGQQEGLVPFAHQSWSTKKQILAAAGWGARSCLYQRAEIWRKIRLAVFLVAGTRGRLILGRSLGELGLIWHLYPAPGRAWDSAFHTLGPFAEAQAPIRS